MSLKLMGSALRLRAIVLSALVFFPAAAIGAVRVETHSGQVEVWRKGQPAPEPAFGDGTVLLPGDELRVARNSGATLLHDDGSRIALGAQSVFIAEEDKADSISLLLKMGKLWAVVSKRAGRRFSVRTPVAVAAVRGTEFSVEVLTEKKTAVEVFGGLVAVRGALGSESMISASQRVDVNEGRLGSVERFTPKPEQVPNQIRQQLLPPSQEEKHEKPAEQGSKDGKNPMGDPGRRVAMDKERFKQFVDKQAGEQMQRDQRESASIFEHKAALFQEGKILVDAFGRRVRVEEFITRPAPDAFKFISLNFRDGRTDSASVEVVANAPLPEKLSDAGNLWFSQGQPQYWVTKQRLSMSNGVDSIVELGVDGAPQPFTFAGQPIFDPATGTFIPGPGGTFYRTLFGNRYEFINGNAGAIADIFHGAFRPVQNGDASGAGNVASGMMWRTQPVKVNITDGTNILGSYWTNAFVTGSGSSGLSYAEKTFQSPPDIAHYVTDRAYFNFVDNSNGGVGNGILDFGEALDPGNPAYFHDIVLRMNGTSLVALPGAGARQAAGDTIVFSDTSGSGSPTGNPQLSDPNLSVAQAAQFAHANPRDWLVADQFAIDEFGSILPTTLPFSQAAPLFVGASFERKVRSSRFSSPDIDVVMSPEFIFQSGVNQGGGQQRPIPSTGP